MRASEIRTPVRVGMRPMEDMGEIMGRNEHPSGSSPATPPTPDPQPSAPAVQQVVQTLTTVAGFAGKILWEAIDLVFNISGMYHDIQTLTDANASWWDKGLALGDLTGSIIMDINMLDGAGEAMQAARIGAEIAEKGVADVAEDVGKDAVSACGGGLSFIATTKVATQVGEQAIGTLKVGEKVWAYNSSTKKMELQPILHVWINHDNDLVDLTITPIMHDKAKKPSSEVIHTNQKHPFLTVEKGFLPVGKIKLGMHVVEANGKVGMVSGWKVVPGVKVMYNLEVAHDHTFVVGVGMWVVHNCGDGNVFSSRNSAFRAAKRDAGIPMGQQPDFIESVKMTNRDGSSILGGDGSIINTREYHFTNEDGSEIVIQDHSAGHSYGGAGDQGPHMNVRPGGNTRTGHIDGTLDHYSWLP